MRRWPLVLIGPIVSLVALVLVVRGLDVARLIDSLHDLRVSWLALMIPVYLCAYLMRGLRWQLMLHPAKPVRLGVATSIIFVGMMANNLLPARLGELVRAFALRRREKLPTAFGLASIVAERTFDGAVLLLIFCATTVATPFPESLDRALASMGWIAGSVFLAALNSRSRGPHSAPAHRRVMIPLTQYTRKGHPVSRAITCALDSTRSWGPARLNWVRRSA